MKEQEEISRSWMETAETMNTMWLAAMKQWNKDQFNRMQGWAKETESSNMQMRFGFFPYKSVVQTLSGFTKIGLENQAALLDLVKESFSMQAFENMYPQLSEDWYKDMMRNIQDGFSPLLKVFNAQQLIRYNQLLANKQLELMQLVYRTSISAMENYSEALEEGQEKFRSIEDIYNVWSAANEKAFADLFHSEQYVKLQQELEAIREEFQSAFERPHKNEGPSKTAPESDGQENKKSAKESNATQEKRDRKQDRPVETEMRH